VGPFWFFSDPDGNDWSVTSRRMAGAKAPESRVGRLQTEDLGTAAWAARGRELNRRRDFDLLLPKPDAGQHALDQLGPAPGQVLLKRGVDDDSQAQIVAKSGAQRRPAGGWPVGADDAIRAGTAPPYQDVPKEAVSE